MDTRSAHRADPAWREVAARCRRLRRRVDELLLHLPLPGDTAPARLRRLLGRPPDLAVRPVAPGVYVLCLRGLVDASQVSASVLEPLRRALAQGGPPGAIRTAPAAALTLELTRLWSDAEAVQALLAGRAVVAVAGVPGGWAAPVEGWPKRTPDEPPGEFLPKGPHLGFIETLDSNVALLRLYVRDRRLRLERFALPGRTAVTGMLLYLQGVVDPRVLRQVRRQLRRARPSFATSSLMLQQWLTPHSGRLFPTMRATERPDHAAAALLEGRVVLFLEGSPAALIAPTVFTHLLQAPDDYVARVPMALATRWVRATGLATALLASPLYVAALTINQELVPTSLFLSVAQSRLNVPLSALVEVLILEVVVEVIREAGIRLPAPTGQSIAIIGAVVVGQSAVLAGLVSAPSTVVVSLGFIASFILPSPDVQTAVRILRYPLILLAGALGVFGVFWGLLLILIYLAQLNSFGVPYLAPFSPLRPRGLQDTLLYRLPLWRLRRSFLARGATAATARRARRGGGGR